MPSKHDTRLIVNHVLKDQERLRTAFKVASSVEVIRDRILTDFSNAVDGVLGRKVKNLGGDWRPYNDLLKKSVYGGVSLYRESWDDLCYSCISKEKRDATSFIFGVKYGEKPGIDALKINAIRERLDSRYGTKFDDLQNLHWIWWRDLRP